MTSPFIAASAIALASFLATVSRAAAQTIRAVQVTPVSSHDEWQYAPPNCARASFRAPIHVWVGPEPSALAQTAARDCMKRQHDAPSANVHG